MTIEELMDKLYDLVDNGRINQSAEIQIRTIDNEVYYDEDDETHWIFQRSISDFIIDDHASSYNYLILEEI